MYTKTENILFAIVAIAAIVVMLLDLFVWRNI